MARQCFDLMVHSVHAIPEAEVQRVVNSVLRQYGDLALQGTEAYVDKVNYDDKVHSIPLMVTNPYLAPHIGTAMPILVRLLDRCSGVAADAIAGKGYAENLAVEVYNICLEIIERVKEAVYRRNGGNISRDDLKYTVSVYMRIS